MMTYDNDNKSSLKRNNKNVHILIVVFFSRLVLIADAESKEDKQIGFTDTIMSTWLHVSSLCSYDIRLTFQYSIANENDVIQIYFIEKNRTKINLLGQWKGIKFLNNNQPIWQYGNVTFKSAEEFRV